MKKIVVIGLGIIGGSICAALTKAGYTVDGTDLKKENVEYAKKRGYIADAAADISLYDVVFIAVPPKATISLLQNTTFKTGALVSDICGVKEEIEKAVFAVKRNYRYVGIHPMAGKETSGIEYASPTLFAMANLVITVSEHSDPKWIAEIKEYAEAMKFGKIVECSAREHDKKIALTSQLAHIVANAYVKSPEVIGCYGFTGGSFQDMTRIAGVDEKIWTELYLANKEHILEELDVLIENLSRYRKAIEKEDEEALAKTLKEGRLIRENIRYKRD